MTIGRYGYDLSLGPNPDFQVEKTCVLQNQSPGLTSDPLTDAAEPQTGSVRQSADPPGAGGAQHGHVHRLRTRGEFSRTPWGRGQGSADGGQTYLDDARLSVSCRSRWGPPAFAWAASSSGTGSTPTAPPTLPIPARLPVRLPVRLPALRKHPRWCQRRPPRRCSTCLCLDTSGRLRPLRQIPARSSPPSVFHAPAAPPGSRDLPPGQGRAFLPSQPECGSAPPTSCCLNKL